MLPRATVFLLLVSSTPGYDGPAINSQIGYPSYVIPVGSAYGQTNGCFFPGCASGFSCSPDAFGLDKVCFSGKCDSGSLQCTSGAECSDGVKNGWETFTDCGGNCAPCKTLKSGCLSGFDCESGICTFTNGENQFVNALLNLGTSGDNGGGRCAYASTTDKEANGNEVDIDCGQALCGGYKSAECPFKCKDAFRCKTGFDCASSVCIGQEYETVQGSSPPSPTFCLPPSLSSIDPSIGARIRGGMRVPGINKFDLDFDALKAAVGFMIDVPPSNIQQETLNNEYLSVEVGNASYMPIRRSKGWRPYWEYPDVRRQRDLEEEEDIQTLFGAGLAFMPSPASSFGTREIEAQRGEFRLEIKRGSLHRGRGLQGSTYTKSNRRKDSYNFTLTDLVNCTRVRWLTYVGDYETLLLRDRMNSLFSLSLLPGGWAAEQTLQKMLDWVAQDAEYCQYFGARYTLPSFNLTGVNCTEYLNCTTFTPMSGRVDGPWKSLDSSTGLPISSRYDYNETTQTTVLTRCYSGFSPPSKYPSYPFRERQLVREEYGGLSAGSGNSGTPRTQRLHSFSLSVNQSPNWMLHSPYIWARLREWVGTRCAPLWQLRNGDDDFALEEALSRDPIAKNVCPIIKRDQPPASQEVGRSRDLGEPPPSSPAAGVAPRRPRRMYVSGTTPYNRSSSVLSSLRLLTATSLEMGLLPEIPRVNFASALVAAGVNMNHTVGPIPLAPGGTLDTATYGRAPPDVPSDFLVPVSLRVLVDPRGTPASPLVRDAPFPVQPVLDMVDRHGRHLKTWKGSVTVKAFIDTSIYPADLFVFGTPSPSPSKKPVIGTHYTEDSVLVQSLYPDNVLVQLVPVPLQLLGATSVTVSTETGLAEFTDLYITRTVKNLQINFSAVFTTKQLSMRIVLSASTRPFDVLIPPPAPLVLPTRFMLPLAATVILLAIPLACIIYGVLQIRLWIKARHTRSHDLKMLDAPPEKPGESLVSGGADSAAYVPTKHPVYDPEAVPPPHTRDPSKGPHPALPRFNNQVVHSRDPVEEVTKFAPWRYVSGLASLTVGLLGFKKEEEKKGPVSKYGSKHPLPETITERLQYLDPPPTPLSPGSGLQPLPIYQEVAWEKIAGSLPARIPAPLTTSKRSNFNPPPQASSKDVFIAESYEKQVLGHPELDSLALARLAQEKLEREAAEKSAEILALEEAEPKGWFSRRENKRRSGRMDTSDPLQQSSSMSSRSQPLSTERDGSAAVNSVVPTSSNNNNSLLTATPSHRTATAVVAGSFKAPKPTSSLASSIMAAFMKHKPLLVTLPPFHRNLNASDDPPPLEADQVINSLENWAHKARARAVGEFKSSTVRSKTRSKTVGGAAESGSGKGPSAQEEEKLASLLNVPSQR